MIYMVIIKHICIKNIKKFIKMQVITHRRGTLCAFKNDIASDKCRFQKAHIGVNLSHNARELHISYIKRINQQKKTKNASCLLNRCIQLPAYGLPSISLGLSIFKKLVLLIVQVLETLYETDELFSLYSIYSILFKQNFLTIKTT